MEIWPEQDKAHLTRYVDNNVDYYIKKWTVSALKKSDVSWNWAAFIFGPAWLGYRRMYGLAFILILSTLVGTLLMLFGDMENSGFASLAGVLVVVGPYIWSGVFGNSHYRKRAEGEIRVQQALSSDEGSIAAGLGRAGGTSIPGAICFLLLSVLASLPSSIPVPKNNSTDQAAMPFLGGMRCSKPIVSINPDTYLVNNEADFGISVKAEIKNSGDTGYANIVAKLSTSEGSFERQREFYFEKDSEHEVEFKFQEPTVNASNIQAIVECSPK